MNPEEESSKVIYILQHFPKDADKLFKKEGITWMVDPGYNREEFTDINEYMLKETLFGVYIIRRTFEGIFLNTYPLNKEKKCISIRANHET